jgi:tetracycline 7-halogenase / FADH2 O2-dependent halogenase
VLQWQGDVLVIGSGFGGSLAALIAQRLGRTVLVVDRGQHPRFAIGESSTPLANLVLESLSKRFDLPWLSPLANYASWKRAAPELDVGLKRGFSYFHHQRNERWSPGNGRDKELLVAASHSESDADTHWLRSDFDSHLVERARQAGIPVWEQTALAGMERTPEGWQLWGQSQGQPCELRPRFVVDATGEGSFLAVQLGLSHVTKQLRTRSRAVFGHFRGVQPWGPLAARAGGQTHQHPFPCDAAALHHVFDGGWMWVLRFDSGVTSAGFSLDPERFPLMLDRTPAEEWRWLLSQFPSIEEQFASATVVAPQAGITRTGRLQRGLATAAGSGYALLPNAVGFIDPLHSTGNAHTLLGLEHLATIWEQHWGRTSMAPALEEYSQRVLAELLTIDQIVAGCQAGFSEFPRMVAMSLFYFVTAIWSEHRRRSGQQVPTSFLCADEPWLQTALSRCRSEVLDLHTPMEQAIPLVCETFGDRNLAGLGDPRWHPWYPYPAE